MGLNVVVVGGKEWGYRLALLSVSFNDDKQNSA